MCFQFFFLSSVVPNQHERDLKGPSFRNTAIKLFQHSKMSDTWRGHQLDGFKSLKLTSCYLLIRQCSSKTWAHLFIPTTFRRVRLGCCFWPISLLWNGRERENVHRQPCALWVVTSVVGVCRINQRWLYVIKKNRWVKCISSRKWMFSS